MSARACVTGGKGGGNRKFKSVITQAGSLRRKEQKPKLITDRCREYENKNRKYLGSIGVEISVEEVPKNRSTLRC